MAEEEPELNSGHYFELMDRAMVALHYLHDVIGIHPVTRKNRRLERLYASIEKTISEFYIEAGVLYHGQEETGLTGIDTDAITMNKRPERKLPAPGECIHILGYELRQTCDFFPEQYDVFKQKKLVGYLRLNDRIFEVRHPDVGGEVVYEALVKGQGAFDDNEREQYLTKAIQAIDAKVTSGV